MRMLIVRREGSPREKGASFAETLVTDADGTLLLHTTSTMLRPLAVGKEEPVSSLLSAQEIDNRNNRNNTYDCKYIIQESKVSTIIPYTRIDESDRHKEGGSERG